MRIIIAQEVTFVESVLSTATKRKRCVFAVIEHFALVVMKSVLIVLSFQTTRIGNIGRELGMINDVCNKEG